MKVQISELSGNISAPPKASCSRLGYSGACRLAPWAFECSVCSFEWKEGRTFSQKDLPAVDLPGAGSGFLVCEMNSRSPPRVALAVSFASGCEVLS